MKPGDDFSGCRLFSIIAWNHVSWPGNDFFGGSRCTDDGVKANATDSMKALTGIEGRYDRERWAYLPPAPYRIWGEVVERNGLRLCSAGLCFQQKKPELPRQRAVLADECAAIWRLLV